MDRRRFIVGLLSFAGATLAGCGGGHTPGDALFTLATGRAWLYSVTGTVTLPASLGGGTQNLQHPDLPEVEAIFWTSPGKNTTSVGQARLQLAHQLIAAQINSCVVGTTSAAIAQMISDAVAALDGIDTAKMNTLTGQLDTFNTSGDSKSLPNGLKEFKADANGSKTLANPAGPGPGFK